MKKNINNNKIVMFSNNMLIVFVMLSFLFTSSKFRGNSVQLIYLCIPLVLILCIIILKQTVNIGCNYIWFPFIILVIIENMFILSYNSIFMYILLFVILIEPSIYDRKVKFDIIFYLIIVFSTIYALSCIVQIIYPKAILKILYFLFDDIKLKTALSFFYGKRYHTGITYQADVTAGYIIFGIFSLLVIKNKINKSFYLFFIIHIIGLTLTAKRGHLLFLLLSIGIVNVLKNINKNKIKYILKYVLIVFIFMCILYMIYLYTNSSTLGRYVNLLLNNKFILSGRNELWKDAIKLIKDNWLFGVGWGNYIKITKQYTQVHNVYLQLLCECGLFGLIFFILPAITSFNKTIKRVKAKLQNSINEGSTVSLLTFSAYMQIFFLLYCLSGNPLYDKQYFLAYFISTLVLSNKYKILK